MGPACIVKTRLRQTNSIFFLLISMLAASEASVIHRWSFSEASGTNVLDSIGSANGFVAVIGTNTDYSRIPGAIRLTGGTRAQADYVQLPAELLSSLTNVSVEIWATPRAGQTWSRIFDFGTGTNTTGTFYLSFCRGSTSLNQQRFEFGNAPTWRADTAVSTTVSNEYQYVVTWSANGGPTGGGLAQWYRDGVLITNVDTGAFNITNVMDTVLWLGRSQYTADNSATADYNEVRIYSHPLSPTEIYISHTNGPDNLIIPPPQASNLAITTNNNLAMLVLSWTPGPGSAGSVAVMSAGQAPSGQPTNGVTYSGNAKFGNGQNLENSNYVVFGGSGSTVTVSNLTPGVRYYAAVYSYTGS